MYAPNQHLLQPGGEFNLIWLSGNPLVEKIPSSLKRKMTECNLEVIQRKIQPYIFNFSRDEPFDRNLALPLNTAYRLVFGILRCHELSLDIMQEKFREFIVFEMRVLQAGDDRNLALPLNTAYRLVFGILRCHELSLDIMQEKFREFIVFEMRVLQAGEGLQVSVEEISSPFADIEDIVGVRGEEVVKKKRKLDETYFDEGYIEEMYYEGLESGLGRLQIQESTTTRRPSGLLPYPEVYPTEEVEDETRMREQRRREFTEFFDILSEVSKSNEDIVEVAREAFSGNPILSEVFERRISGDLEGIETCYDKILDDKAAQTELYIQKLKLVDQNVINEECIAEVGRRAGRSLSIRADKRFPSDIYSTLVDFVEGKSTTLGGPLTPYVTREEIRERMDITAPSVGAPEVTTEELFISSPVEEPSVPFEVAGEEVLGVTEEVVPPQVEEVPVITEVPRRRRVRRRPRAHERPPSSLEAVRHMETLENIIEFFSRRLATKSPKLNRRRDKISGACESFVISLLERRKTPGTRECVLFDFWFRSLEDIANEIERNNGCWMNVFERLQALPFVYDNKNGLIFESQYREDLNKILRNVDVSSVDYGLYSAIVDMPIIGLSNNPSTREIIKLWLQMGGLEEATSQMSIFSDYVGPSGKSYNFLPKCLPVSYGCSDFTNSLKTLSYPYEKLKYPFLKKISRDYGLYHRRIKPPIKGIKEFTMKDFGSWNFNDNVKVIEMMFRNVILSDNVLSSKFHNITSVEDPQSTTKIVKTYSYKPNGTIVWSDIVYFVDSLFKACCEGETSEIEGFSDLMALLNELFLPSEREPPVETRCDEVEYESRLPEIQNSLTSEKKRLENYFYNKCKESVNSKFEHIMPTMLGDETSIFDDVDMEDVLDDLNTFELELFLGYISPVSSKIIPEPEEATTFDRVNATYEKYESSEKDLGVKRYDNTKINIPIKWDDILMDYLKRDRKPSDGKPITLVEKPKSPRIGIPQQIISGEGMPEEVPKVSRIEEIPEGEFEPPQDLSLPPPHVFEEHEGERMDVTIPLPEFLEEQRVPEVPERLPSLSPMQTTLFDERRKEIEELLERPDVAPESRFPESAYRYPKEKTTEEEDLLKIASHQIGRIDLPEIDEGIPPSDLEELPESPDVFSHISLQSYKETPEETYQRAKLIAGDSKMLCFKDLVKHNPTKACAAKVFLNITLLGSQERFLKIHQKYPEDIKIRVESDD
uniref:Uncharacterized protein n=1 Tax=Strongyloides papillosus TaxID=174720 RepID=A0A0N5CEK5_STREA